MLLAPTKRSRGGERADASYGLRNKRENSPGLVARTGSDHDPACYDLPTLDAVPPSEQTFPGRMIQDDSPCGACVDTYPKNRMRV